MDFGGGTKLLPTVKNREEKKNIELPQITCNINGYTVDEWAEGISMTFELPTKYFLVIRLMLIFNLEVQVKLFAKSFNFVSLSSYFYYPLAYI